MSKISFEDYLFRNNWAFNIAYNRYGYIFGHGFLCVSDMDFMEEYNIFEIEGGDVEAYNMIEFIDKMRLKNPDFIFVEVGKTPVEAVIKCQNRILKKYEELD